MQKYTYLSNLCAVVMGQLEMLLYYPPAVRVSLARVCQRALMEGRLII
jgi:hypothetical protein